MKMLIFLRHAKADNPPMAEDSQRPLSQKGRKDAALMGALLEKAGIRPQIIFSSPARRALETAGIAAENIGVSKKLIASKDIIYACDGAGLLRFVEHIDEGLQSVMLVGHNPAIEECVSSLLGAPSFHMSTASLACFESDARWKDFPSVCALKFFIVPGLAKKLV